MLKSVATCGYILRLYRAINTCAKCDICGNCFSLSGGLTSNLVKHLKAKRPTQVDDIPRRDKTLKSADDLIACRIVSPKLMQGTNGFEVTSGVVVTVSILRRRDTKLVWDQCQLCHHCNVRVFRSSSRNSRHVEYVVRPASMARQKRLTSAAENDSS